MNVYHLTFLTMLGLAVGCGRETSSLPYSQMSEEDVVATVNGVAYTKGELERDIAITDRLFSFAGYDHDGRLASETPQAYRQRVLRGFIDREILLQEAARRHIELTDSDMAAYQRQFAASLSDKLPLNFDSLLSSLGPLATVFRNNLKKDALAAKIEQVFCEAAESVLPTASPTEIAREREEAIAFNRKLAQDTRALTRLATNSWKSIRAGNDFKTVGKKMPEIRPEIAYEPSFADPAGRFRGLRPGELTPPRACDGGLEIVKAERGTDGKAALARILFRLKKPKAVLSPEETVDVLKAKAVKAQVALQFKALKQAAKISINPL